MIFNKQFSNIIEWNESRDDVIFWLWRNQEIKKGSRLIIRPGQDAIFLYNGKIEGIFTDEGNYAIESDIIPFLTTLKSFKFGFNTPLRAEVLFVNTKEFLIRWGTKNAINIPTPQLKGGLPIRSHGTITVKVNDYMTLIDKISGIKQQFTVEDVKERIMSKLNQLLMLWISKEGKDLFNLQINASDIAKGIQTDLDMELFQIGLTVTTFKISSFTYPENIQKMIEKAASFDMVSDVDHYQKMSMIESLSNPNNGANNTMASMAQMGASMAMGTEMMKQMQTTMSPSPLAQNTPHPQGAPCSNCHQTLPSGTKFCPHCGTATTIPVQSTQSEVKFCTNCGNKVASTSKFCNDCGHKL